MDLPKGHWIHGAMAKEKARMGKKGGKASGSSKTGTKKAGSAPMGNGQPNVSAGNVSGDGYGLTSEHQGGSANGYTC